MAKNKFLRICLFALICFVIAGCASYQSQTSRIEIGMTKQQVTNIMGQPLDRTLSGNTETWYYWKAGWSYNPEVWIYFTDGLVSGMKTDN